MKPRTHRLLPLALLACALALGLTATRSTSGAQPVPSPVASETAACEGVFPPFEPASVAETLGYSLENAPMLALLDRVIRLDPAGQRDILTAAAAARSGSVAAAVDRAVRAACLGRDVRFGVVRFAMLAPRRWDAGRAESAAFQNFANGPLAIALGAAAVGDALPADIREQALRGFPPPFAPVPVPSPCVAADGYVRLTHTEIPGYPRIARQGGAYGSVFVRIGVSAAGLVKSVKTYETKLPAGSREAQDSLIDETLLAAALSEYAPELKACVPEAGGYLFRADFNAR